MPFVDREGEIVYLMKAFFITPLYFRKHSSPLLTSWVPLDLLYHLSGLSVTEVQAVIKRNAYSKTTGETGKLLSCLSYVAGHSFLHTADVWNSFSRWSFLILCCFFFLFQKGLFLFSNISLKKLTTSSHSTLYAFPPHPSSPVFRQ